MFSETSKRPRSAAWRISLWGTLWFACGTLLVFLYLHHSVAEDVQDRTDTWLMGESRTMADILQETPKNARYQRVVSEVEELASREVPDSQYDADADDDAPAVGGQNTSVAFLQTNAAGQPEMWAGKVDQGQYLRLTQEKLKQPGIDAARPFNIHLSHGEPAYRVAAVPLRDGGHIYLGVSSRLELRVLNALLMRFLLLWLLNVLLGFGVIFLVTRSVLKHVQEITRTASQIGETDLSARVPVLEGNDEVVELASTVNRMLDRIARSVQQLQTITNALAHDLRSPLTAIRAKLERSLTEEGDLDGVVTSIEEIDRLTEMLTQSLDVAEAEAGVLRLERLPVDLDALLGTMVELYQPSLDEKGLRLQFRSAGRVEVLADEALLHRMVANLFDNEQKHLPPGCTVTVSLSEMRGAAVLLVEDDGPGFSQEVIADVFRRGVKGAGSRGHGIGLAFVEAVVTAHGGWVLAMNREEGGARVRISLPLSGSEDEASQERVTSMMG